MRTDRWSDLKTFQIYLRMSGVYVRGVTSGLRFLVTPSGSCNRSPSKEIEAKNVGAKIVGLNFFLNT